LTDAARAGSTGDISPRPDPSRDLGLAHYCEQSLRHSRARRDAAALSWELGWASKRGISLAALFAATAVPGGAVLAGAGGVPSAASARSAHPTLKRGDHGDAVRRLQRALRIPADGLFGNKTMRYVRGYQHRHGLHADGIVGPATWHALGGAARSHVVGGNRVVALQRALGVPADGNFGPQTARAVRRFQRSHHLGVDGVVGPVTWRALGLGSLHGGPLRERSRHHGGSSTSRKIALMIAAGNRIAHYPYVYGGGHASFSASGYDCSGSVSYVLHGARLLSSPLSSGGFESYGRPGRGRHVTIYANSGHVFMTIDGRRYDTSGQSADGSRWHSSSRSSSGYVVRHPAGL
jgi:cell wall-associated NlpC family hydrolase